MSFKRFLRTSGPSIEKKTCPAVSTVTNKVFSGRIFSEWEEGGLMGTASFTRNFAVSMKNVTSRNARSTMGVMSREGALRGSFILAMNQNYRLTPFPSPQGEGRRGERYFSVLLRTFVPR